MKRNATAPPCPKCGAILDGVTAHSEPGSTPSPGDLSVCVYCVTPLVFTDGLGVALLPPEELAALPRETQDEIARIMRALAEIYARSRKPAKA